METIATQLLGLNKQIESLQAEADLLKAELREAYPTGVNEIYPTGVKLLITPGSRLDDGLARKELSSETYESVSKLTLDTVKAKKVLTEDVLEVISKPVASTVKVSEV